MKIKFGGYYSMPLDFSTWSKEEQKQYIQIGIEDGWLDPNPHLIKKWLYKIKNALLG